MTERRPQDDRSSSIQRLLDELCVDLGFCLPRAEQTRLEQTPPPTVDAFTDAVFVAEGLDPRMADKALWRQVRHCVAKYISDAVLDLDEAHKHSSLHRAAIEASCRCGCFYCLAMFHPDAITQVGGPRLHRTVPALRD